DSFDYGHALWTQQAMDVLDALGIEQAVVVGHSAGAMTAVLLAADHPERFRGVVLTGHGFSVDPAHMLPLLPGVGELWAAQRSVIGDTFSDSYRERAEAVHQIRGTRAAYLAFMRSQYVSETSFRLFDGGYEEIAVPVLQMHGTLDKSQTIESARELSSRLADTRFVAFEGSDHFIHIEAPDQWADEVIGVNGASTSRVLARSALPMGEQQNERLASPEQRCLFLYRPSLSCDPGGGLIRRRSPLRRSAIGQARLTTLEAPRRLFAGRGSRCLHQR
ncbi:MAG: alpha/beta hydrolase, partial [Gammaproteobacteria bacterium]|nr:alpha/beta hydrolase [Gammaproteobacteria bacterium]